MDLQYWLCRPMSKMQSRLQEVGLLLFLLLLFLWQLSDCPISAWCTCLTILVLIARAVVSDFGHKEVLLSKSADQGQAVDSTHSTEVSLGSSTVETDVPHVNFVDMATGLLGRSNSTTAMRFENEVAFGNFVFLHRPIEDDSNCPQSQYFVGKRRAWELRFQCTFKKTTRASDMRVGVSPFSRLPISAIQASMQRFVLKIAGSSLGSFYNSPGDDAATCGGEAEHPVTSVTLSECDQHICHSLAEEQPSLFDHQAFSQKGRLKVNNAAAYREAGETHTFCFWGPSRFFNLVKWRLQGIPMLSELSLDALNGPPPLVLSVYILNPDDSGRGDVRHLASRKKVLVSVAGWSSLFPPSEAWQKRLTIETCQASAGSNGVVNELPTTGHSGISKTCQSGSGLGSAATAGAGCCGGGIYKLITTCMASMTDASPQSQRRTHSKSL